MIDTQTTTDFASRTLQGLVAIAASAGMLMLAAGPAEAAAVKLIVQPAALQTADGRAVVDARIERAAQQVCTIGDEGRNFASRRERDLCIARSLSDARAKVAALQQRHTVQMAAN